MKAFAGFAGFGGVDIALRQAGYQVIGVAYLSLNSCI
jgi:site-specific DNA-cytosine methylase